MGIEYPYEENMIRFDKKQIILKEEIAEIVNFEKCAII